MIKKIAQLFGYNPKRYLMGAAQVKFFRDAAYYGEHGKIVVSNIKEGLSEEPVAFVFVGMVTPPKLNDQVMNYLFAEAWRQGFIPHHLDQYGRINSPVGEPIDNVKNMIIPPKKAQEAAAA